MANAMRIRKASALLRQFAPRREKFIERHCNPVVLSEDTHSDGRGFSIAFDQCSCFRSVYRIHAGMTLEIHLWLNGTSLVFLLA
jgi:hypothetical protein